MRHRGPFNTPLRYAAGTLVGLASFALCAALATRRAELEPVVRLLHPFMLGIRGARYEPWAYEVYEVLAGIFGALPFVALAYGLVTKSRTDRKIDSYLADRLPQHDHTISGDPSSKNEPASRLGHDGNDRF